MLSKSNVYANKVSNKTIYLKPSDVENIPAILKHVSSGIKNNVNAPVFGEQCKTCPHYLCTY